MTWRLSTFIREATSPHDRPSTTTTVVDDGDEAHPAQRIDIKRWKNEWMREDYTREDIATGFVHSCPISLQVHNHHPPHRPASSVVVNVYKDRPKSGSPDSTSGCSSFARPLIPVAQ